MPARLLVVAAAMLWGTTGTARALGPDAADPSAVGAARLIVGGTVLVVYAVVAGHLRGRPPRSWPVLPTLGAAAAMAAYQPCFFGGVARTGVAIGTVVGIGSAPVFTGILAVAFRGERPGPTWLAATALAVAGTAVLLASGSETEVDATGVVLALGAGAAYAVYVLCTKLALDGHPADAVVPVTFGLAALLVVPFAVGGGIGPLLTPSGLALAAHLGVVTVAVAYLLFGRGLTGVDVATAGTLTLAEPATAAVLGILVLDERLSVASAAGVALVAGGLVLAAVTARSTRRRQPAPAR